MNIHIVMFAYALADDLMRAFACANESDTTFHLFLHSKRPDVVKACEFVASYQNVIYYPYGENRGTARSTNEAQMAAIDSGADVFIGLPDDVYVSPGDIHRIARTVLDHPECSYVESMGYVERTQRVERLFLNGAAINLKAIEKVGYLDQNFYPTYFDDTDWAYRARLAGMYPVLCDGSYLVHAGSKTLIMPELAEQFATVFEQNKAYFVKKWGGDGGQEKFTVPFNNPLLSIKIERENVDDPYPAYKRSD